MSKKKIIKIISTIIGIILILVILLSIYKNYRIKHAKKIVKLKTTELEVYSNVKLSDIIEKINGKLIDNPNINTKKLGKEKITFKYINNDNIKVKYTINLNIKDTTPPIISLINNYIVTRGEKENTRGEKENIEKELFCGDNYDPNPKCYLKGDYDLNKVGTYSVEFIGKDSSNNTSTHKMNIIVKEKNKSSKSQDSQENNVEYTNFNDVIKKYKTKKTEIGIDVSHWQGDIDFNKVKSSKVEFAYIRVGRGNGIGKDYILDDKFKTNIKGFNKVGIPVGVYFYSSANSLNDARREAKWILKQIKKYDVSLEVVFDWENWDDFQKYNLSFYNLTEVANEFSKTIEKAGYKSMVYSSKNYLESMWYDINSDVFLAHYTDKTDYEGKYKVWQICNNGKVKGIKSSVDIDIRYK